MSKIQQSILDSIEILLDKRVSQLDFDKTVRATVIAIQDQSIGRYKVRYQNSEFSAYAIDSDASYKQNNQVYVEIPSKDYDKTKYIIGTVKQLGSRYIDAVTAQGKMTTIGSNIFSSTQTISFCSYNGKQQKSLENIISTDSVALSTYQKGRKHILLGMNVKTALPTEQQVAGGNYGIIVQARYYSTAYKNHQIQDESDLITRTYVLDVNNMLGQPYKYTLKNRQYAIFSIDGDNLKDISSITAFCRDFPVTKDGQPQDIFLSDFQLEFMEPLTVEELNGSSLKIITPRGAYLTSENDDTKYLQAEVKIKGKKVNLQQQKVEFYWFIKDTTINSNSPLYSAYAGEGWRCLNLSMAPDYTGRMDISPTLATSDITTFKCVGIYNTEILSSTIEIGNKVSTTSINITSSAGKQFYFDTGKTTLTCNVKTELNNLSYHWGYRSGGAAALTPVSSYSNKIDVAIAEATSTVTYECTVQSNGKYLGTASITLTNGIPQNEYSLIINNGTQIFKYDEYGTSPASRSAKDPITILPLTFTIYNDQGQDALSSDKVTDALVQKLCEITWVLPDDDNYTMLQQVYPVQNELVIDPSGNGNINRRVIKNVPSLSFDIKNRYDADALDNNIRLEVNFQGHSLVASTNFTFTKQGELGTNGTKYVSRIVPFNNRYEQIYLQNGHVEAWGRSINKSYDQTTFSYKYNEMFYFDQPVTSTPLRAQIWTGINNPIYDSIQDPSTGNIKWEFVDIGRKTKHNAEINNINGAFYQTGYDNVSTVVKSTISSNKMSQQARKYYATYPLTIVKSPDNSHHAVIDGGYTECMFNSDGTRGSFNTKSFRLRIFNGSQQETVIADRVAWAPSWYTQSQINALTGKNGVDINPPARYNSESTNNYIRVTYDNYVIIISIHFYLNRYGLAAMNDWDGTSIKLNQSGDEYILAPQIGAGEKSGQDNSFTGVAMGKSFGVNGNNKSAEIGLMGFGRGIRTFFLDSKTGNAVFGAPGSGQILIKPGSNNRTNAIIQAGNYNTSTGTGMMIDLEMPSIRFGSGNFSVTPEGYLTAKGGGTIADWKISDDKLISQDNGTTLSANGGNDAERINVGSGKFVIYGDGRFKAANSNFAVDANGNITAKGGTIGGWNVTDSSLTSSDGTTALYSGYGTGQRINVNGKFIVNRDGSFSAANENFNVDSTGNITAKGGIIGGWNIDNRRIWSNNINLDSQGSIYGGSGNSSWSINHDGVARFTNVIITGNTASGLEGSSINFGTGFGVNTNGSMWANAGNIGGWTINTSGLSSALASITPTKLKYGNALDVDSAGNLSASGTINALAGKIGGCNITGGVLQADNLQLNSVGWSTLSVVVGLYVDATWSRHKVKDTGGAEQTINSLDTISIAGYETTYSVLGKVIPHQKPLAGMHIDLVNNKKIPYV